MIVLACLALNIAAFFYLHAWRPILDFVRALHQIRMIRAFRVAGLLLLMLAVNVMPVHAQTTDVSKTRYFTTDTGWSDGDDALLKKFQADVQRESEITGYPPLDNGIRYVWNNCGKLMAIFVLLAAISMFRSKLDLHQETYGDVLRREARKRGDFETTASDDIHDPFNSPEGMQPITQYVPVRTRRG
jgi:hypothetical protein